MVQTTGTENGHRKPRAPEQKTIREHGEPESYPMHRAVRALKVKPEGDAGGLNDLT